MIELPTPNMLEKLAIDAGISMAEACRRAGLQPSTFTEWRRGMRQPNMASVQALLDVLQGKERAS